MLRYPITQSEAKVLTIRLLGEPEFRDEFLGLAPVKELVEDLFSSSKIDEDSPSYSRKKKEAEQKVYEIARYLLRDESDSDPEDESSCVLFDDEDEAPSEKKKSIPADDRLWDTLLKEIPSLYSGWWTSSYTQDVINDFNNGSGILLRSRVKEICRPRLYQILNSSDNKLLDEMVHIVCEKLKENNYLNTLDNPAKLRGYIKRVAYTSFLKWEETTISEPFHNPHSHNTGYAHLTIKLNEERLKSIFGSFWYEWNIQDPFRSSVVTHYHPEAVRAKYNNVADFNREIETELNSLFLKLKQEKGICRKFPISHPSVKYDKTYGEWRPEVEVIYSPDLDKLLAGYRKPDPEPDSENELEEIERIATSLDTDFKFLFRTDKTDEKEDVRLLNLAIKRASIHDYDWDILWRSTILGQSSVTIGEAFYEKGIFNNETLKTIHKFNKETGEEIHLTNSEKLEIKVNSEKQHFKGRLQKQIKNLSLDERVLLKYIQRLNS